MPLPPWVLPFKEPHTAIKYIMGAYKYEVSYQYDPDRKRTIPLAGALLGKITEANGGREGHGTDGENWSSSSRITRPVTGVNWLDAVVWYVYNLSNKVSLNSSRSTGAPCFNSPQLAQNRRYFRSPLIEVNFPNVTSNGRPSPLLRT